MLCQSYPDRLHDALWSGDPSRMAAVALESLRGGARIPREERRDAIPILLRTTRVLLTSGSLDELAVVSLALADTEYWSRDRGWDDRVSIQNYRQAAMNCVTAAKVKWAEVTHELEAVADLHTRVMTVRERMPDIGRLQLHALSAYNDAHELAVCLPNRRSKMESEIALGVRDDVLDMLDAGPLAPEVAGYWLGVITFGTRVVVGNIPERGDRLRMSKKEELLWRNFLDDIDHPHMQERAAKIAAWGEPVEIHARNGWSLIGAHAGEFLEAVREAQAPPTGRVRSLLAGIEL